MSDKDAGSGQGGNAPRTPEQTATTEGGNPPATGQDQPYLDTWKTKDAAEKGIADLKRQLNEARSEKDRASASNAKTEELLERLTEAATAKTEAKTPSADEIREQWRERLGGDDAPDAMIDLVLEAVEEAKATQGKEQQAAIEALTKLVTEKFGAIESGLADKDADYQANKAEVDRIEKDYGMSRDMAIRFVKNELSNVIEDPGRPDFPGGTGSPAGGGDGGLAPVSDDEIHDLEKSTEHIGKISQKEREYIEKMAAARAERRRS